MSTSLLRQALARLDEAVHLGRLAPALNEALKYPLETVAVRLLVTMDDGAPRSFRAWRCRYVDTLGPTIGGVRFDRAAGADLAEALALSATLAHAALELPFGGAHGLIQADRALLSAGEAERLLRAYARAFAPLIGADRDILASDRGVDADSLGWMADEYRALTRSARAEAIVGKPPALGGLAGADDAVAAGAFRLLRHLEREIALGPGSTVAIQGFGRVGSHLARLLDQAGYVVVAISTSRYGFHAPQGLPVGKLLAGRSSSMLEAAGEATRIRRIEPDALVGIPCDLLVASADHGLIGADNVHGVKARAVLELASAAIAPEAEQLLCSSGVIVLPDLVANAGRAAFSWFEWLQNRRGECWSSGEVREKLESMMAGHAGDIWNSAKALGISMRAAACARGLARIAMATEARHPAGSWHVGRRTYA